jgi:NitT/TauT family transport system substrate-binding protein
MNTTDKSRVAVCGMQGTILRRRSFLFNLIARAASVVTFVLVSAQTNAETIKVGFVNSIAQAPVFIADSKGYFAAEGLAVKLAKFNSGQQVAVATASSDVDFGAAGFTGGLYNLAGGGALRIIAGGARDVPGFDFQPYIVSNHAWADGLRSYKDIPGHSFATTQIGSPVYYGFAMLAAKYHFDMAKIRVLPLQSFPNVVSAVVNGKADMTLIPGALSIGLIQRGDVKLLGWSGNEVETQISGVYVATRTADTRRDLVLHFLRAYRKATHEYHDAFTGPDEKRADGPKAREMLAILAKYTGLSIKQARLGVAWIDAKGRLDVKDVFRQVAWYKSRGMLKPGVKGEEIIDKRYVVPLPRQ